MITQYLIKELCDNEPTGTLVVVMKDVLSGAQWKQIRERGFTVVTAAGLHLLSGANYHKVYVVNGGSVRGEVIEFLKTLTLYPGDAVYMNSTYFWNEV